MAKHIVISLIVEVSVDVFRIKHGWKNVAMLHCFFQGGLPRPAGQLEFESNRLVISIKDKQIYLFFGVSFVKRTIKSL